MKKGIRKPKLNTMTAEQIVARKKELLGHLKELRREVNYQPEKRKKKEKKSIDQIRKEAELRKKRLIAEMRRKMQGDAWDAQVKSGKFGSLVKTSQSRKKKRASGVDIRKFVALRKTRMNEVKHSDDEILHYGVKGMRRGIRRWLEKRKSKKKSRKKKHYPHMDQFHNHNHFFNQHVSTQNHIFNQQHMYNHMSAVHYNTYGWSDSEEPLLHFGVKGMRWGIRRRLNNYRETRLLNKQDKLAKSNPKTPKQGYKLDKKVLKTRYRLGKLQAKRLYKLNKASMKEQATEINKLYKQAKKRIKAGERLGLDRWSNKNLNKTLKKIKVDFRDNPKKVAEISSGVKSVYKSTRKRNKRDNKTRMREIKSLRKGALRARTVHDVSFTTVSHSDNEQLLHYGVKGMRRGVRRWLENRKATQAQRKAIKAEYKTSRKALRKSLRAMKKEYRKGNGKIAFNENYRGLKGIRKAFNDRKTVKYLAETHGKDLAKLTLSKKMFNKAKKRYKKDQVRAFKMERKNALKALKFKGVVHSDYEVVLLHHGVLGQRWGIRRRLRNATLNLKSKFRTRHQKKMSMDDRFKKKLSKKRKISEMSDDELRAKIARMKLEGDYKKAVKDSGKGISGKIKKVLDTQVGYTKDGKAKKLGPVLAEKLLNTAFNNDEVNKALSSIATRGTKSLKSKLKEHTYSLSRKKKKGQWK